MFTKQQHLSSQTNAVSKPKTRQYTLQIHKLINATKHTSYNVTQQKRKEHYKQNNQTTIQITNNNNVNHKT